MKIIKSTLLYSVLFFLSTLPGQSQPLDEGAAGSVGAAIDTPTAVTAAAQTEPDDPDEDDARSRSPQRTALHGRIENSGRFPAVAPEFRAGAILDFTKLKKLEPDNYWYKIPPWYVGGWKSETSTTISYQNLRTGYKDFDNDTRKWIISGRHGNLKDRAGDIWEYCGGSFLSIGEGEGYTVAMFTRGFVPVTITESKVVMKFVGTDMQVNLITHEIKKTAQVERIQSYTSEGNNVMKVVGTIRDFDEEGLPVSMRKVENLELRREQFAPICFEKGRDLRPLFKEFLVSHGMPDLVPLH